MRTLKQDKREVSLRAQIMAGKHDDPVERDAVLRIAGQVNGYLQILHKNPLLDKTNPWNMPGVLMYTTGFLLKTYQKYALPLLPEFAVYYSDEFGNGFVDYDQENPKPTHKNSEYMDDPKNWPNLDTDEMKDKFYYLKKCHFIITTMILNPELAAEICKAKVYNFEPTLAFFAGLFAMGWPEAKLSSEDLKAVRGKAKVKAKKGKKGKGKSKKAM